VFVGIVVLAVVPAHAKLLVRGFVAWPIPAHIPSLGAALFDVGMDETVGSGVVGFEGVAGWGWPEAFKEIRQAIASGFSFCCRSHCAPNSFACSQNGTVGFRIWHCRRWGRSVTRDAVSCMSTARVWKGETSCIGVGVESHVAGMVAWDGQRASCSMIE
jgi:hypothetical protein